MKIIATNSSILVQRLTRMVTLQPYLQGSKSKSFCLSSKTSFPSIFQSVKIQKLSEELLKEGLKKLGF